MRPECFDENNVHSGNYLITIGNFDIDLAGDVAAAVKWCPECGAIVVDKIIDGSRRGLFMKMDWPKITRKSLKNNQEEAVEKLNDYGPGWYRR